MTTLSDIRERDAMNKRERTYFWLRLPSYTYIAPYYWDGKISDLQLPLYQRVLVYKGGLRFAIQLWKCKQ